MSHRLVALFGALALFILVAATAALVLGIDETRLAGQGRRHDFAAEELSPRETGWVALFGCLRHDLAVGVTTRREVYRLGAAPPASSDDDDRVFTPLAARQDCDEERRPQKIYALVEDDDALGNTIGRVYKSRVAPPPVPAFVDGVIGFGAGHGHLGEAARAFFLRDGIPIANAALLQKGKHPGVRWVAITTAAAGAHGYLLVALGAYFIVRRRRQLKREREEREHLTHAEQQFFDDEPPQV
jgi:hypothetical protein